MYDYMIFLLDQVNCVDCFDNYTQLFLHLLSHEFVSPIPLDDNRISDGLHLRDRYFKHGSVKTFIPENCSLLEVMVALDNRMCVDLILDYRDPTHARKIFIDMLRSMCLDTFENSKYDADAIDRILDRFDTHDYMPTGRGSLFYIPNRRDMRETELWYQAMYYFNENEKEFLL